MSLLEPHTFKVKIITPVHIGMSQEKTYQYGVDYVWNDDTEEYWFLNAKSLLKDIHPDVLPQYTKALVEGNTEDVTNIATKYCSKDTILLRKKMKRGIKEDVKQTYQDGLGRHTIPGSSIKGSLRSVLLNRFLEDKNSSTPEKDVFGHIDNNLLRLLQVSDVDLSSNQVNIFPAKIFSASQNGPSGTDKTGMWKHQRVGGANTEFRSNGFVAYFECLKPNQDGTVRINLERNDATNGYSNEMKKHINNYELSSKFNEPSKILALLRDYTNHYLAKEIAFFERYPTEFSEQYLDSYKNLLKHNKLSSSAVIRVGAGSGFHAITGDWQNKSKDHFSAWNYNRHHIHNKTRKFIFSGSGDKFKLAPMGFIRLSF